MTNAAAVLMNPEQTAETINVATVLRIQGQTGETTNAGVVLEIQGQADVRIHLRADVLADVQTNGMTDKGTHAGTDPKVLGQATALSRADLQRAALLPDPQKPEAGL